MFLTIIQESNKSSLSQVVMEYQLPKEFSELKMAQSNWSKWSYSVLQNWISVTWPIMTDEQTAILIKAEVWSYSAKSLPQGVMEYQLPKESSELKMVQTNRSKWSYSVPIMTDKEAAILTKAQWSRLCRLTRSLIALDTLADSRVNRCWK